MHTLHLIILIALVLWTADAFTQSQTAQDPIVAVHSEKLRQLELQTDKNAVAIAAATMEMAAMRASLNQFIGVGMGIGATLTVLQALILLTTYRNGRKS